MHIDSNQLRPVYPQMENTGRDQANVADYNSERILPGVSDTQDSIPRKKTDGEKLSDTPQASFTLSPRKGPKTTKISPNKEDNYVDLDPKANPTGTDPVFGNTLNKIFNKD
jgi:hypothetical protein